MLPALKVWNAQEAWRQPFVRPGTPDRGVHATLLGTDKLWDNFLQAGVSLLCPPTNGRVPGCGCSEAALDVARSCQGQPGSEEPACTSPRITKGN